MELRQLRYFVKIAETLNFSEAAKCLFVTQSTLSQQLKQLEQEFDAQLLQRDSHCVRLTEAGMELLPYARKTLRDAETCLDKVNDLKEMLTGTLNIGVTYSFSPILTEAIFDFKKLYPHVKLNIFYKPMEDLMEMLRARDVDFVLAFKPLKAVEGVESHILFQSWLALVVNESHPLASERKVTLEELSRYDLALPARGLQARNAFEKLWQKDFSQLRVHIELNDVNILLKLVRLSHFATVLSETSVHNEPGMRAIPIDAEQNIMEGCVHTLKDSYRKRSMQEFIRILSDTMAVRERIGAWI